jgi:hypothetical protein
MAKKKQTNVPMDMNGDGIVSISEKFSYLDQSVRMLVKDKMKSLIIAGDAGVGKTYTVMQVLQDEMVGFNNYKVIKGYCTPLALYRNLYDNNGSILIFDDTDAVLEDKKTKNILKAALDSYEVRKVSWNSTRLPEDLPDEFDFVGRIIFITNKNICDLDKALVSRSFTIDMSLSSTQKIERMEMIKFNLRPDLTIKEKDEIIDFFRDNLDKIPNPAINLRAFDKVATIRKDNPDWVGMSLFVLRTEKHWN